MKLNKFFVLILIISLITIWPLLGPGFFKSHDGELHLARVAAYSKALKAGQFPVRWAGGLNYSYGYPIFNFVYPLPYFIASIFYLLSSPLVASIKLVLAISIILSAIFMFKAIRLWTKSSWAALLASSIYLLAPYRFLDTYIRMAFGEAVAFIFPPLTFYGFLLWQKKKRKTGWFLMVISLAGLVLSHNAFAVMFFVLLVPFLLFETREKIKELFLTILSFLFALGLSAFFWLPALLETKYTLAKYYLFQKDFHDYFVPLKNLVYMPWQYSGKNPPAFLGIISIFIFIMFCLQVLRKKIKGKKGVVLTFFWLGSVFLTTEFSAFFWEKIPFLPFFQIPWRFLGLTIFITGLMAALTVKSLKNPQALVLVITLLSITFSIPRLKVWQPQTVDEQFYINYPKSTTWHNEATPIWTTGEADHYPKKEIELVGEGQIKNFIKQQTKHNFVIKANKDLKVIDNTVYFPGWQVFVNDKQVPIQFQNPDYRGLITFDVSKGKHNVSVIFGRTKVRLVAEIISIISLVGLGMIGGFQKLAIWKMENSDGK